MRPLDAATGATQVSVTALPNSGWVERSVHTRANGTIAVLGTELPSAAPTAVSNSSFACWRLHHCRSHGHHELPRLRGLHVGRRRLNAI